MTFRPLPVNHHHENGQLFVTPSSNGYYSGNLEAAKKFNTLTSEQLNKKPTTDGWSILECLEHLNRYAQFYHPHLKQSVSLPENGSKGVFKTGFIGNYLVNMVIPKEGSKKMKTFKSMNPALSKLPNGVLETFIENQEELLGFIEKAHAANLNKKGIPVTFSKFIKLKTGDTLRFMVYHNQRHVAQATRLL